MTDGRRFLDVNKDGRDDLVRHGFVPDGSQPVVLDIVEAQ